MRVIRMLLRRDGDDFNLVRQTVTSVAVPLPEASPAAPFQALARNAGGDLLSRTGVYLRDFLEAVPDEPGGAPRPIPLPPDAHVVVTVPDHAEADHVALVRIAPRPHPSLQLGELQRGMLQPELAETEVARFKVER